MQKTLLLLLLSLCMGLSAMAQGNFIAGTVTMPGGQFVPNQRIDYFASDSVAGFFHSGTVYSDTAGNYFIAVPTSPAVRVLSVYLSWAACGITQTVFLHNIPTLTTYNITICGTASPCDASFTISNNPAGGSTLSFSANQSGNTTYSWDFGDNTSGSGQNVTHTYQNAGTYQVCLLVSRPNCTDTACAMVVVSLGGGCQAAFTSAANGNTVTFTNASVANPTFLTTYWDFGDGNFSTAANPVHTYAQAGIYNVCLTIIDSMSFCVDTYCRTVQVGSGTGLCDASFFFQPLSFTPLSYNFGALFYQMGATYVWNFGDGSSGTGQNVTHSYNSPGTYTVCLLLQDPVNNCVDTSCMTVVVANQNLCDASFYYYPDSSNLNLLNFGAYYSHYTSYTWSFGDGSTGTDSTASHLYANPGMYNVCLWVQDTLANCADSMCFMVYAGNPNITCSAQFGYHATGNGVVSFQAFGSASLYQWNFGDGNSGSGATPVHTYTTAGTYNVCLVITDYPTPGTVCRDTVCQTITTHPVMPPFGFPIVGIALTDSIPADDFTAFLIVYDSTAGTLIAVDTFVSTGLSGIFYFQAPGGDYRVKVALNSGSLEYNNFMPTYYSGSMLWSGATVVNANNFPMLLVSMVRGNNPGGPGFIGGLISQGANKTSGPGDPMEGVHVLLMDMSGNPVAHTSSDANGRYTLSNLPWGTYQVIVEMWGRQPRPIIVTIGPGTPSVTDVDLEVNSTSSGPTALDPMADAFRLRVYPVPAGDYLNLRIEAQRPGLLNYSLSNTMGQNVLSGQQNLQSGDNSSRFDVGAIAPGFYTLNLSVDGKKLPAQKVAIQR